MTKKEEVKAQAVLPVTVQIDLEEILKGHAFRGENCVEYGEEDEVYPVPTQLVDLVANSLAHTLKGEVSKWVKEIIQEEARVAARAEVDKYFDGTVKLTNSYGHKEKELPLREFIVENIEEYINEKVNSRGEVERYSREGIPRIKYLVNEKVRVELGSKMDKRISEVIEAGVSSVEDVVSSELSKKIAKKLAQ